MDSLIRLLKNAEFLLLFPLTNIENRRHLRNIDVTRADLLDHHSVGAPSIQSEQVGCVAISRQRFTNESFSLPRRARVMGGSN